MKKLKYRSNIAIILAILEFIDSKGMANMTQISTYANVSYTACKSKIEQLIETEMIQENRKKESVRYSLTEKGFDSLRKLRELTSFLTSFGLIDEEEKS